MSLALSEETQMLWRPVGPLPEPFWMVAPESRLMVNATLRLVVPFASRQFSIVRLLVCGRLELNRIAFHRFQVPQPSRAVAVVEENRPLPEPVTSMLMTCADGEASSIS